MKEENEGVITGQIIITRRVVENDIVISTEFSEDLSVGEALMLMEFGKIEMYSEAMGLTQSTDDED